ncbi:hypothetical protein GQR58_005653 [Nymphon striatum]|nr:hypothetical protein GQR58_005653 [Nymphon striatum]
MGGRSRWDGFPNSWGYKRAGRQSGRGKRRKQTSVYVSSLCRASISEQRDYLPSGQGGKEEEFGGERSGYRGGRRPRSQGLLLDVSQLANILTQARGPILARITQLLATRFGGSGRLSGSGSVDVTEWVECLEGMCRLENVSPADIIGYVLEGNASRIYGRMMVGDASQWAVVKAALLGEYALPRGEAHRRFIGRRLEADEPVDIYVDSLERLGGRLGLASDCAFFRTHFYEGLPASVNKWAVMREDAYTARFETVVSRVRDYVRSGRAIERRSYSASVQAGLGAVRRVGLGAAVPPNVGGASLQRGNPALDFEGLAERMARAYRGHHSLAGRLPAIEGQGAASHGLP